MKKVVFFIQLMTCGGIERAFVNLCNKLIESGKILVDPRDYLLVARHLDKVITKEALKANLIRKGLENIERFSGEKFAKSYLNTIFGVKV